MDDMIKELYQVLLTSFTNREVKVMYVKYYTYRLTDRGDQSENYYFTTNTFYK